MRKRTSPEVEPGAGSSNAQGGRFRSALMPHLEPLDRLPARRALLSDEDEAAFSNFFIQVRASLGPYDIIDEIFVSDVVEYAWEVFRLRRWTNKLLKSYAPAQLDGLLSNAVEDRAERAQLVQGWRTGDTHAIARVHHLLAMVGVDLDTAHARAFAAHLEEYEVTDRLITNAERRRNDAMRQIQHRRDLRNRLAAALAAVEDAEFAEVDDEDETT